ncbi:MAG: response regulator transcription factor [Rhodospirillaceae bacterium]
MAKILIIEPEPVAARLFQIYLADHVVHLAYRGIGGLELFAAHSPDLVITNAALKDISGLNILRSIRAHGTTPVIIVADRRDWRDAGSYVATALEAGAAIVLRKPVSRTALLSAVDSLLGRAAPARRTPTATSDD